MSVAFVNSLGVKHKIGVCNVCGYPNREVGLDGFPKDRVVIDVDKIQNHPGNKCDFVVAASDGVDTFLLPMEFKTRGTDFSKIQNQLESSVAFFQPRPPNQIQYYPVLVSVKLTTHQRKKLANTQIQCGNRRKGIRHVIHNKPLKWSDVKNSTE